MKFLDCDWPVSQRTCLAGVMLSLGLLANSARAAILPDAIMSTLELESGVLLTPRTSADGRYTSYKFAPPGAPQSDIFVYDWVTGTTEQVNRMLNGSLPTNARCDTPILSGNGRYVVFACYSVDMGILQAGTAQGYFLYDRQNSKTETIAAPQGGIVAGVVPAGISADGRYVAYRSNTDGHGTYTLSVRDRVNQTTQVYTPRSILVAPSNGHMFLSNDGRFISYQGKETTVSTYTDMSVFDRDTGVTDRVDITTNGLPDKSTGKSDLSMSADGNIAVYASDYGGSGVPAGRLIYMRDRAAGKTEIVSDGSGTYMYPNVSANGRYITFTGFKSGETVNHLYRFDRLTKKTRTIPGVFINGYGGTYPTLSADGRYVTIETFKPTSKLRKIIVADLGAAAAVSLSGSALSLTEGGAAGTYSIVLTQMPSANVTVAITPDKQLSVVRSQLVFTPDNWNVPQVVSVQALQDGVVEGKHSGVITHSVTSTDIDYTVVKPSSVTVAINDAVTPTVVLPSGTWIMSDLPVSGTAAPGANVLLTATNRSTGWLTSVSVLADAQGNWSRTLTGLSDGVIEIDAQADGIHSTVQSVTVALSPPPISLPPEQQ